MQYQYSGASNTTQDNLNGTFTFGTQQRAVQFVQPVYVSGPVLDSGWRSVHVYEKAHYFSAFAQDKWRFTKDLTVSLGLRYDLERIPLAEPDNPLVEKYPTDDNNIQPRVGSDLQPQRRQERRSRRIRPVLRQDSLRSDWRALHRRVQHLEHADVPGCRTQTSDPRNGQFPTDPFLVNGPTVNRDAR